MKCDHDITITDDAIGYELVSCSKCGMKKVRVAAYVRPLPAQVNGSSEGVHAIDGVMVEGEG